MPGGRELVLSGMLMPMLQEPREGGGPVPEILRRMMLASSEGRLLWRRSSIGWSNRTATGLWAGLMLEHSSRDSWENGVVLVGWGWSLSLSLSPFSFFF